MSTDLYRVRVLDLDPAQRKVVFRVFLVYYDWEGVPTDPSFFLRILWDEADTRFGRGGPLGKEVSVTQYLDEKWIDANTARFVERVTRTALRNHPLKGKKPPTFVYSEFKDEDILTQGDYEVIVTDARWLKHLKKGQTWQTTSYETRAKMPAGRQTVLLDKKAAPGKPAKGAAAKKGAAKEAAVKAPAAKKAAVKKGAAKKAAVKAPAAKKTAAKKPTKKTASDKTVTKKTAAKKPAAKATAAKAAAKKPAAAKGEGKTPAEKAE